MDLSVLYGRLAQEMAKGLVDRPGKRWQRPLVLRSRIVPCARVCRARGKPVGWIFPRLGLVGSTLA
jgi:hypothetical protein